MCEVLQEDEINMVRGRKRDKKMQTGGEWHDGGIAVNRVNKVNEEVSAGEHAGALYAETGLKRKEHKREG